MTIGSSSCLLRRRESRPRPPRRWRGPRRRPPRRPGGARDRAARKSASSASSPFLITIGRCEVEAEVEVQKEPYCCCCCCSSMPSLTGRAWRRPSSCPLDRRGEAGTHANEERSVRSKVKNNEEEEKKSESDEREKRGREKALTFHFLRFDAIEEQRSRCRGFRSCCWRQQQQQQQHFCRCRNLSDASFRSPCLCLPGREGQEQEQGREEERLVRRRR